MSLTRLLNPINYRADNFLVNKATKVLCYIARESSTIKLLAKYNGLLLTLKSVIKTVNKEDIQNYHEARLNCLFIIANLACTPENMIFIISFAGMIDTLL